MSDAKDDADDPNLLTAAEIEALREDIRASAIEIDEMSEEELAKEGNNP